jgi:hypothetical protein
MVLLTCFTACASENGDHQALAPHHTDGLEVVGSWTGAYGEETITATQWGNADIRYFDNATNVALTQNAANDAYNPSKFNRLIWTDIKGDNFYYCTVDFALDTQDAAEHSTQTADVQDLDGKGCGGFPWSHLFRKE